MPPQIDLKARIQNALAQCAHGDLLTNALALFAALGYRSDKQIRLPDNTARGFLAEFGDERFNAANALTDEWRSIDLVLQLTDTEINHTAQRALFDSHGVDRSNYQSYLIFAIELAGAAYARTALAKITREVNKLFAMPALILFKHGNTLTLSVIDRRLHKRDETKDVLEKVTLIKDIRLANPHRAHIEILFDLALPTLLERYHPQNFAALHDAWRAVLDTSELNKKFFRELANWFYWAQAHVSFPSGAGKNQAERNATALIRLITRLIFTWFIQEKDLVPPALFDEKQVSQLLADFAPARDTYYRAILQNLFFGTLNTEMGARAFRHEPKAGQRADDHMSHNRYRYKSYFANPDAWLALTRDIPFLNGGLFECLDKEVERDGKHELLRVDGFSDHPTNELNVPNYLFFADENDPRYFKARDNAQLNEVFGTKNKKYQVRGLVRLLHRYKFTIDENTPLEQEVALDPELLGKVFENLLAAYNPETGVTARKQTGSFYTPREIVNYMVDEALMAYLETQLKDPKGFRKPLGSKLRRLFAYTDEPHQFDARETAALIEAIDNLKLLDPACGSGAFPMGALHKLVLILRKLDPDNARWKAKQIAKASEIPDTTVRERVVADIEQSFNRNALDYGRKLYLIENCIYGVDIQPIAVQIAKLRCFIALIVDEKMDDAKENRGIRPLPNLETKFVAANTLLGLDKPKQMLLRNPAIESKEKELADVRRSLFTARTRETKEKHRKRDAALRKEIGELLKKDGWLPGAANQLATWDPYDQNAHADFFDAEWMFGVTDGFDVVIGNPPYLKERGNKHVFELVNHSTLGQLYHDGKMDYWFYFLHRAIELSRNTSGVIAFITSRYWINSQGARKLIRRIHSELKFINVIDIGSIPVFEEVAGYHMVSIYTKNLAKQKFVYKRLENVLSDIELLEDTENLRIYLLDNADIFSPSDEIIFVDNATKESIVDAIALGDICDISQGVVEATDKVTRKQLQNLRRTDIEVGTGVFVLTEEEITRLQLSQEKYKILKPYLDPSDVAKYSIRTDAKKFLIYSNKVTRDRIASEKSLRNLRKHLDHLSEFITSSNQPYGIHRPRDSKYFEESKIIFKNMFKQPEFALDREKYYVGMSFSLIISRNPAYDLRFILGILNSRFANGWFYSMGKHRGAGVDIGVEKLREFPIANIKKDEQQPIINLVDRILAAKRADADADTRAWEREIDELVYQLYGLTEDEIKIVEGKERLERGA